MIFFEITLTFIFLLCFDYTAILFNSSTFFWNPGPHSKPEVKPTLGRKLDQRSPEVLYNLNYSVILWFHGASSMWWAWEELEICSMSLAVPAQSQHAAAMTHWSCSFKHQSSGKKKISTSFCACRAAWSCRLFLIRVMQACILNWFMPWSLFIQSSIKTDTLHLPVELKTVPFFSYKSRHQNLAAQIFIIFACNSLPSPRLFLLSKQQYK